MVNICVYDNLKRSLFTVIVRFKALADRYILKIVKSNGMLNDPVASFAPCTRIIKN